MNSGDTRIKYVNTSNHDTLKPAGKLHGKSPKPAPAATTAPAASEPPKSRAKARARHDEPEADPALQTYEECRRAFNELAAMHSEAQTEASAAMRRLERAEQELAREREQGAKYTAKIAGQETELRRVKEGKKAVEDLNSRLSAKLAAKAPDEKLMSAHRAAQEEVDRLKSRDKAHAEERERLRERAKAHADLVEHAEKALGICARACEPHAPEIARDMRETQETLRAFQRSARA